MSKFKSNLNPMFRSKFSEDIFNHKYRHEGAETWDALASTLVQDVCGDLLSKTEISQLTAHIRDMKFIPGGRYLYYAGRPNKFFNNCYLLKAEEDTREDWANLSGRPKALL
jgi:ribonucleoside-diphosphate reductase alpha chain